MSTVTHQVAAPPERGGVLDVVRRRPLLSFIVLAITASWLAWIPLVLSPYGLGIWDVDLAGGNDAWQLFAMLPGAYLGPIGAALFVTAVCEGRAGVRAWTKRLFKFKVNWRWYVCIFLGTPAAVLLTSFLFSGGDVQAPLTENLIRYVPVILMQMITTGLAEEPGWRDFALPRAQRLVGPVGAAVGVGVLWGVWHLPLFMTLWGDAPTFHLLRPVAFIAFCVMFNVVMTWVFNRTGQSLPMAMLLHVGINTSVGLLVVDMFPSVGQSYDMTNLALLAMATVGAVITFVATRGRLGYRPEKVSAEVTRDLAASAPLVAARPA